MSEYGNGLLLTVIGLADSRPLRPWIVCRSLIWCFRHHLQLYHRGCTQADGCSDTVVSGITASDDHHFLILAGDKFLICQV